MDLHECDEHIALGESLLYTCYQMSRRTTTGKSREVACVHNLEMSSISLRLIGHGRDLVLT